MISYFLLIGLCFCAASDLNSGAWSFKSNVLKAGKASSAADSRDDLYVTGTIYNVGQGRVIVFKTKNYEYSQYFIRDGDQKNSVAWRRKDSTVCEISGIKYPTVPTTCNKNEVLFGTTYKLCEGDGTKVYLKSDDSLYAVKFRGIEYWFYDLKRASTSAPSYSTSIGACKPKPCTMQADFAYNVDRSGSISYTNMQKFKKALADLNTNLDINQNRIYVTLVRFDWDAETLISRSYVKSDVLRAISNIDTSPWTTCTCCGLELIYYALSSSQKTRIIITFTDGYSNEARCPKCKTGGTDYISNCMNLLKAQTPAGGKTDFYSCGIGINNYEIRKLADNIDGHYWTSGWDDLWSVFSKILVSVCTDHGTPPTCNGCKGWCNGNGECICGSGCEHHSCSNGTCNDGSRQCVYTPYQCPDTKTNCKRDVCNSATDKCILVDKYEPRTPCQWVVCNPKDDSVSEYTYYVNQSNRCYQYSCRVVNGKPVEVVNYNGSLCDKGNRCMDYSCDNKTQCHSAPNEKCSTTENCKVAKCDPTKGCSIVDVVCPACQQCNCEATCNKATGNCEYSGSRKCENPDELPKKPGSNDICLYNRCGANRKCEEIEIKCEDKCQSMQCYKDECHRATCKDGKCEFVDISNECGVTDPCNEAYCDPTYGCKERPKVVPKCKYCDPLTGQIKDTECPEAERCIEGWCDQESGQCKYQVKCSDITYNNCSIAVCDPDTGNCLVEDECQISFDPQSCKVAQCDTETRKCVFVKGECPYKPCKIATCDDAFQCLYEDDHSCESNNNFCFKSECDASSGKCIVTYDNRDGSLCEGVSSCVVAECIPFEDGEGGICRTYEKECGYETHQGQIQPCLPMRCNGTTGECERDPDLSVSSLIDGCGNCYELGIPCNQGIPVGVTVSIPIILGALIAGIIAIVVVGVIIFAGAAKTYSLIARAGDTITGNVVNSPMYEGNDNEGINPAFAE